MTAVEGDRTRMSRRDRISRPHGSSTAWISSGFASFGNLPPVSIAVSASRSSEPTGIEQGNLKVCRRVRHVYRAVSTIDPAGPSRSALSTFQCRPLRPVAFVAARWQPTVAQRWANPIGAGPGTTARVDGGGGGTEGHLRSCSQSHLTEQVCWDLSRGRSQAGGRQCVGQLA